MVPWQLEMEPFLDRIVGQSRVNLQQSQCSSGECNLGNFFTDAMLHAFVPDAASSSDDSLSNVTIALTSAITFKGSIPHGNITYKQLLAMCPWQNRLVALSLRGRHIVELLEHTVANMNASSPTPRSYLFLQVSGLRIRYDLNAEKRVFSVQVRCSKCEVPRYNPLDLEQNYRVLVMEYMARGKMGFSLIRKNAVDPDFGPFVLDALMDYMNSIGPITNGIEQRIQFVNT